MRSQAVQGAVIRGAIQAPESRFPDIGQPRAELKTQQPKQAKNNVGIGCWGATEQKTGLRNPVVF